MRVAIYARVSTETQEQRGTIGSQLEVLRAKVMSEGDELVAEFCDDGYSGARLDRPGLDSLRDQAEAGAFEAVWCLSPDRLARSYANQMPVLDELARFAVSARFTDTPPPDNDPQARLLVQVQGVIAEYEKVKIAERNRRGKLWRSKVGEVVSWRVPYSYRRVPRTPDGQAHLAVFEPEAAVVRRVFDDYVSGGYSIRDITRRLNADRLHLYPHRQAYLGALDDQSAPPQRGPHREGVFQHDRNSLGDLSQRAHPATKAASAARRVDRDCLSAYCQRRCLRSGPRRHP